MRPVLQSRKHIVQIALSSQTGVGTQVLLISESIEGQHTKSTDVSEGALVKAVWIELWCVSAGTTIGSFTSILYKNPGGANGVLDADMAALHDWDNKKNILYTTQGITPDADQFPMNVFKGWSKIPKGKQRQGLGDKIQIGLRNNIADDLNFCGFATFKEYT